MSNPDTAWQQLGALQEWARELGFADAAVSQLRLDEDLQHLQRWLDEGLHGGMQWMQREPQMRADPARLRPGTLSVISARLPYPVDGAQAQELLQSPDRAYISRYALGRDYHRVLRGRLLKLAQRIEQAIGPFGYRVLADSAPALEKAMARDAGLGWIGKHTLLIHREAGSWFFLGEIYSDLPPPPPAKVEAQKNLCGSCSACIEICPTRAIIAPYRLDARRCISYLTIEHHGPIPLELRPLMGNRIFGCDDCQLVCPWNRHAQQSAEADFRARHGLDSAGLLTLFAWSEAQWLQRTEGMALRRAGYPRWLRNLAIALGNAPRSESIREALTARLGSQDEVLEEHLLWALQQHQAPAAGHA